MSETLKKDLNDYKGIWVFTEIQDHERVLEGALELLAKGREMADKLGEKLYAVVLALDAEQYLPSLEKCGPDVIIYFSHNNYKHYNSEIFPEIFTDLIKKYKPSIMLFPSTETGKDLAPRLAQRFSTGLTSHCTDLDILDSEEYGTGLLLMKRPAFSGNMIATIICPHTRPQMATVQPGVFEKKEVKKGSQPGVRPEIIKLESSHDMSGLKVVNFKAPVRWDRVPVPLERARVIVAGGRGMGSKRNFEKLFELADILNAEVGATRVPEFNGWCSRERLIGQTGKTIKPKLYLGLGISGQIQHTTSIVDSEIIVSVNTDIGAPIKNISDYIVQEDADKFLSELIKRLRQEKSLFNK